MKKIILLFSLCFPLIISAQLSSDDFESYMPGSFDSQWDANSWEGWFGGASSTEISTEQAHGGVNSLKVDTDDDVVAKLGVIDSDIYELTFWQYIPAGNGTYFNLQHNYTSTAGDWMTETYFTPDGAGIFVSNNVQTQFPIVYDQWVEQKFVFNFITSEAQYSYNGVPAVNFAINTNAGGGPGLNQLNGINFFGACLPAGCTVLGYYDDITLTQLPAPDYNARLINPTPPSEYTIVPSGLEQPLNLTADVWNIGTQDITNVTVTFNLKDGSGTVIHTETTDPIATIGSGEQFTFNGTSSYTLSGVDNYTMDFEVNIAEVDEDPADNIVTLQVPFASDPTIYARDDGAYVNGIGINMAPGFIGQNFDFVDQVSVGGIIMAYGGGAAGDFIAGHIFNTAADGTPTTLIATTDSLELTEAGTVGGEVIVTVDFTDDVILPAGNYAFVIEQKGLNNLVLSISLSVFTPGTTWASTDGGGTWGTLESFGFPVANSIRPLITVVGVGLDETVNYVNELHISPNPTKDVVTIDLQLSEIQNLTVDVFNTTGQLIKSFNDNQTFGGSYQLDLENLASGIYQVRFKIGEQTLTRRVVLTK